MTFQACLTVDNKLIERLRQGQPDALAMIYLCYAKSLHSVFLYVTRDERAAEDLTQEFFLRLSSRAITFDSEKGTLEVWLRSVAKNMAIDQMRSGSAKLGKRLVKPDCLEQIRCETHSDSATQRRMVIKDALGQLNPAQRHLLELSYFYGYSHREIAGLLQKPLGTVKSNIRSAHVELGLVFSGKGRRNRTRTVSCIRN